MSIFKDHFDSCKSTNLWNAIFNQHIFFVILLSCTSDSNKILNADMVVGATLLSQ